MKPPWTLEEKRSAASYLMAVFPTMSKQDAEWVCQSREFAERWTNTQMKVLDAICQPLNTTN